MSQSFGRVAVLCGGLSAERPISLQSGQAAMQALQAAGVDAYCIDTKEPDWSFQLQEKKIDRAFLALHGPLDEDGKTPAILESLGIPYAGSGVLASSLAMDKLRAKALFAYFGLPVPAGKAVASIEEVMQFAELHGYPLCLKPTALGSSIGTYIVRNPEDVQHAWPLSEPHAPLMIEAYCDGDEVSVGILGNEALPPVRIVPKDGFYDFDAKYIRNDTLHQCPILDYSSEKIKTLQALAMEAFHILGCQHWGRVDFIYRHGSPQIIELNTIPGLTSHSIVPIAAKEKGIDFQSLVLEILRYSFLKREIYPSYCPPAFHREGRYNAIA